MKTSPDRCPRCDTLLVATALCPNCERAAPPEDPLPLPEEYPVTDAERVRWRRCCWLLLVLGPVTTWFALPLGGVLTRLLPSAKQSDLEPVVLGGLPFVAAVGAAFCLARSQTIPLTDADKVVFLIVMTVVLGVPEVAATLVGFAVLSLFQ